MITKRRILLGSASLVILVVFGFTYWAYTPLGPAQAALDSLVDSENVSVIETDRIIFTPEETKDAGFIARAS